MERIPITMKIEDDKIIIIPDEGYEFEDNCIYRLKIDGIKSYCGDEINFDETFCTKLSPLYCSLKSVKTLLGKNISVKDEDILYNIRENSLLADYLYANRKNFSNNIFQDEIKIDPTNVPIEVREYVRYKTAYDMCLTITVDSTASSGISGTVGDVTFSEKEGEVDLEGVLDALKSALKRWEDAVRGYAIEGRALPKGAVRGSTYIDTGWEYGDNPPYHKINLDNDRGV